MATLSFKNINKIYDNNVQAVFDFNLEIQDKEFIVFVGPSGCGKSTTLRMIAGLEDITSGELYIDNVLVNNVVPKDRNIAMVFQSYALYPHMTVYGNMEFALKLRKIPCAVYEPNEEADQLYLANLELLKEVKKINRGMKKQKEGDEVLARRKELYDQIFANEEQRKAILVQTVGIYTEKITELQKQEKTLNGEIAKLSGRLEKAQVATDDEAVKVFGDAIEQKNKQLADVTAEIERLTNNEVPLFKMRKLTKYEIDLEVNKSAAKLDLTRYLFRKPAALSGGQRQRVALGRAIVRQPKVFLMDEPLSNLDAKLRVQTRSEISKIHESVGATTVYVTHDQTEAMTMASRIVVMKDGYIQQIGTPEEIYSNPANVFVGGFIGSPAMNFVRGVFDGQAIKLNDKNNQEGKADVDEITIKVNKEQAELLKDKVGKEVIVGIRPESMFLEGDAKQGKDSQTINCVCDFRELLGYELVIYTYLCGQKVIMKVGCESQVNNGSALKLAFNTESLYFFDSETELRIK